MPDRTQHIDYEAAVKARGGFHKASEELLAIAYQASGPKAARAAIASAACQAAEHAIFAAFNALAHHGDDPEALRVVHMREWEEPATMVRFENREGTYPLGTATEDMAEVEDGERPAFVTERVDTCLWELEAAVAKVPVLANAKVDTVHGTSDGGWRVEVRVNDQVFAPRFDTLDKATEYRREAAEIVERAA